MGKVVKLHVWKRRHVRASVSSSPAAARRACIAAKASRLTPPIARPQAAPTSAAQYSAGMLPRCAHLRIAETVAPMSLASTSCEGQSASSVLGDSTIIDPLGPIVLSVKAKLSHDLEVMAGNARPMPKDAASQYRLAFIARTKAAREAKEGLTQIKIAKILGMDQGTYKQYETRSLLPHQYMETFCLVTGVPLTWLVTGEGKVAKEVTELLRSAA